MWELYFFSFLLWSETSFRFSLAELSLSKKWPQKFSFRCNEPQWEPGKLALRRSQKRLTHIPGGKTALLIDFLTNLILHGAHWHQPQLRLCQEEFRTFTRKCLLKQKNRCPVSLTPRRGQKENNASCHFLRRRLLENLLQGHESLDHIYRIPETLGCHRGATDVSRDLRRGPNTFLLST